MLDAGYEARASVLPSGEWTPTFISDLSRKRAEKPRPARRKAPAAAAPVAVSEAPAPRPALSAAASTRLLTDFRPLVNKIVGSFQRKLPRHVLREDLMAAAMVGLWDAVRRHGATAGDGFEWYARVRIRGAILDELRSQDWLSRRARAQAEASGHSLPPQVLHIEDMREQDQARCLSAPATSHEAEQRSVRESLERAVEQLPERERLIVSEHYFRQVKFKELSERLGVSEPRVSQLHSRAMRRLREFMPMREAG